jgi:hypothetical protein
MNDKTRWLMLIVAAVVVFALWNFDQLSLIVYPLRLFVTYVHESGHSLAALLTGGRVLQFQVFPNGSGVAITAGGSLAVILPAGYLGAAAFGAALFYLNHTRIPNRWLSIGLGLFLIVFSLAFAIEIALVVGIAFGALLLLLAWRGGQALNAAVLNVLALMTGMNAFLDLWFLIGRTDAAIGRVRNDAAAFSENVFPLPPIVWAALWAALAALMLGVSVWFSVFVPLRRGLHRAIDQQTQALAQPYDAEQDSIEAQLAERERRHRTHGD